MMLPTNEQLAAGAEQAIREIFATQFGIELQSVAGARATVREPLDSHVALSAGEIRGQITLHVGKSLAQWLLQRAWGPGHAIDAAALAEVGLELCNVLAGKLAATLHLPSPLELGLPQVGAGGIEDMDWGPEARLYQGFFQQAGHQLHAQVALGLRAS
jgi:CheY-specific phosphatase CheX